jgi:hypothetical protein
MAAMGISTKAQGQPLPGMYDPCRTVQPSATARRREALASSRDVGNVANGRPWDVSPSGPDLCVIWDSLRAARARGHATIVAHG